MGIFRKDYSVGDYLTEFQAMELMDNLRLKAKNPRLYITEEDWDKLSKELGDLLMIMAKQIVSNRDEIASLKKELEKLKMKESNKVKD